MSGDRARDIEADEEIKGAYAELCNETAEQLEREAEKNERLRAWIGDLSERMVMAEHRLAYMTAAVDRVKHLRNTLLSAGRKGDADAITAALAGMSEGARITADHHEDPT